MAINEKVGILIQAPGEVRPNPGLIGGNYADFLTKELDFLDDSRNFPLASDFASSPAFNTSAGWTSDANSIYGIWGDLEGSYREWMNAYNREMHGYWMSRTARYPLDFSPGYESVAKDPAPWKNDWTGSNALEWIRRTVPSPVDGSFNYPYPEFPVFDHHSYYNNRRGLFHRYLRFHQERLEDIYTNHSYRDGSAYYIDQNAPVATNIDEAYQIGSGIDGDMQVIRRLGNGKILVGGGYIGSYNGTDLTQDGRNAVIFQLNVDGTLDTNFTPFRTVAGFVQEIDIDADGKIILAGTDLISYSDTTKPINNTIDIIRLNSDGTQDNSFEIGSGASSQNGNMAIGFFVKSLSDGKILFGGQFDEFNGTNIRSLVRLNNDGSIDETFSVDFENFSQNYTVIKKGHVYDDGKILLSGYFTNVNGVTASGIVRLNSDGSSDETFNTGSGFWIDGSINDGIMPTDWNYPSMQFGIEVNSEGKIYVGGMFNKFNGTTTTSNFAVLNSDGSLDKFLPALKFNPDRNPNDIPAWRLKLIENDKIVVLGDFRYYGSEDVSDAIIVINPDGTVDRSYDFGQGLNGSANDAIKIGSTLIVVGNFGGYYAPGVSVSKIVAIKNAPIEHTATFMVESYLSNRDRMIYLLSEAHYRDLSTEEEAELATRRADFLATDHTKNQYSIWSGAKAKQIWEYYCNNGWNGGQYQQDTANSGSIDSYEIWPADTTPAEALGATGSVTYNILPAVTTSSLLPSTGNAGDVINVRDWDTMAWDPIRGMWSTALYYRFFEPALTTERSSRDGKLMANNQVTLAMRPCLFASLYIPAFQITADGNINSELKAF